MSKKKPQEKIDPLLPFTPIEIDGQAYKMCFDLGAIAAAEEHLIALGCDANLFRAMVSLTFSRVRILFAVSIHVYHPEVDFEECKTWVTKENFTEIVIAIKNAWALSSPEPAEGDDKEDPLQPVL